MTNDSGTRLIWNEQPDGTSIVFVGTVIKLYVVPMIVGDEAQFNSSVNLIQLGTFETRLDAKRSAEDFAVKSLVIALQELHAELVPA